MRLIDADDFKDRMLKKYGAFSRQPQEDIDAQPTVYPVPIKCGQCKFSRKPNRKDFYENQAVEGVLICENCNDSVRPEDDGRKFVNEDWFCADGELRVSK